jgi:uncharacterized protein YcaQ
VRKQRAEALRAFVRERGVVHPREVDEHFAHGSVTNYWGGSSSATTHLLDDMHYRGLLRVARRDGGIRLYTAHAHEPGTLDTAARRARIDALVDVIVRKYAPLPGASLSALVRRLRYGIPQWRRELNAAVLRTKQRLAHTRVDGVDWYWPADESLPSVAGAGSSARTGARSGTRSGGRSDALSDARSHAPLDTVRLLAPFDPIVWDRRRFELLWGWAYRFEAYTPAPKRKLGYYALPLLWQDRVIGWGNLSVRNGTLQADLGYVSQTPPRDRAFARELEAELDRIRLFLGLES